MGCGSSKDNEDDILLSHKVLCGVAYDKTIKVDFSFNPNKYIANNTKYYKEQGPGKGVFTDERFPPDIDTFFGRRDGVYYDKTPRRRAKGMKAIHATEDIIEWRHAKDIWGDDIRIFGDSISPYDIKIGEVNDSYFVAAMAALSDFPALILQLFKTVHLPPNGEAIEVAVEIDGEWEIVCIDDYFPFNTETNKPIFSDSPTHNLWAVILEKVWAKVNYGYANIVEGTPREIFEVFTPFIITPVNIIRENINSLWDNIKDAATYNCIMACTTTDDVRDLDKVGLTPDQNFYFVNAYEEGDKKNKIKLMTLKYPFGEAPWKGEYSYKSDIWRKAKLRKLFPDYNPEGGADGLFWIDYYNFCKYFRILSFCIFLKPLISCVFKIEKERADDFNAMKIRIEGEGILAINVFKKDYRFHRKIGPDEQVISNIILAKLDKDSKKLDYIASSCDETMSTNVLRGEYICLFNVDYTTAGVKMRKYAVNISTSCKFHVCMVDSDNSHEVLKAIMIPKIESNPKYNLKFVNHKIVHFTGNRFENTSIAFMYIKNQEENEIHYKATISYKNISSIDGDLPVGLKLKVNDKYIFLGNRIKINEPYSLWSMGHKNISAISGEIEPRVDQDLIDNVFVETPYEDTRVNFEFDQPS